MEGDKQYERLGLQVFNATGQLVQEYQESFTSRLTMQRGTLPTGIYFYRLSGDEQLLSTGKVVLQ
ncbi:MAG: T9SS type A sorting domain-containing protein [Aureispira sp.]